MIYVLFLLIAIHAMVLSIEDKCVSVCSSAWSLHMVSYHTNTNMYYALEWLSMSFVKPYMPAIYDVIAYIHM